MTFDNEDELFKIKSYDPLAKLVLRILADDPTAICNVRFTVLLFYLLLFPNTNNSLVLNLELKLM